MILLWGANGNNLNKSARINLTLVNSSDITMVWARHLIGIKAHHTNHQLTFCLKHFGNTNFILSSSHLWSISIDAASARDLPRDGCGLLGPPKAGGSPATSPTFFWISSFKSTSSNYTKTLYPSIFFYLITNDKLTTRSSRWGVDQNQRHRGHGCNRSVLHGQYQPNRSVFFKVQHGTA